VAEAFSVASWNVEHFKNVGATNEERVAFIAEQDPDVLAIYEVEGADVWRELMAGLPGYSFFITSWISRFSDHALLYFEVQKP
jgi:hypothetical protein